MASIDNTSLGQFAVMLVALIVSLLCRVTMKEQLSLA